MIRSVILPQVKFYCTEGNTLIGKVNEILFVVYTERIRVEENGEKTDVTRLISARLATNFERGLYYGKCE